MTTSKAIETTGDASASAIMPTGDGSRAVVCYSSALAAGCTAYMGGVVALTRTLAGFGRELLDDAGGHVRATMSARNLREVGELQIGYAQHRVETASAHIKELADVARVRSEDVIAPFTALLDRKTAA